MKAVQIVRTGGPEVLEVVELALPEPGPGEVRVRHAAIGLNFIDTYHRSGLYPLRLPAVLGREMAGTVEQVGSGVTDFVAGDRVASSSANGAYAEASVQAASSLVRLPDAISFDVAAASLLKGMTAELLTRRVWPLARGDTVLVHAAGGGVGTLLCQWLAHIDVRVIGTVGSAEKRGLAEASGCSDVILYREEDVAAKARALTGGRGVAVAYDSIGKDTLEGSLASLAKRGLFVSFGNASGPVPPIEPLRLTKGGSLFMTRPTLYDYIDTPETLQASASALFGVLASGALKVTIGQQFALEDVRQAHAALQSRATTGASLLKP